MSNLDQLSCKPLLSIWRYWQYQEYSHLSEEKKPIKTLQNSKLIHDLHMIVCWASCVFFKMLSGAINAKLNLFVEFPSSLKI